MLSSIKFNDINHQYKNKSSINNQPSLNQNVAFEGGEFGKFFVRSTKDISKNAAESLYRAGVKLTVKGYYATKEAVQNFNAEKALQKAKETASNITSTSPSKLKAITEKVKALTKEAIDDVRKKD